MDVPEYCDKIKIKTKSLDVLDFSILFRFYFAELRKELGWTQTQLAEHLKISQQLIAAYEAGSRKVQASMLPTLAKLFAVPLEQLIGMQALPNKRGPASTLQMQMEQIHSMPKSKQKFITEMLDALIKQQQSA